MTAARRGRKRRKTWLTVELRRFIKRRDNGACVECGSPRDLTLHHIVPISEGGRRYLPSNIVTLCRSCHAAKHPRRAREAA